MVREARVVIGLDADEGVKTNAKVAFAVVEPHCSRHAREPIPMVHAPRFVSDPKTQTAMASEDPGRGREARVAAVEGTESDGADEAHLGLRLRGLGARAPR